MSIQYRASRGAIVFFIFLASSFSFASAIAKNGIPVKVTELIFFSIARDQTFLKFVENSGLSNEAKKEIKASLKGYSLEKSKLPIMKWREGSSILTLGTGLDKITIDFAGIEKRQIVLNKTVVTVPKDALFSETYRQFKKTLKSEKKTTASYNYPMSFFIFGTLAEARDRNMENTYAAAAIATFALTDAEKVYKAVNDARGQGDASKILDDLQYSADDRENTRLTSLSCGPNMASYNYVIGYVNLQGEPSKLVRTINIRTVNDIVTKVQTKNSSEKVQCEYNISDGVVDQITDQSENLSSPSNICPELPNGAVPATGTSLQVVADCCKNPICTQTVQKAIKSSSNKIGTPVWDVEKGKDSSSVR